MKSKMFNFLNEIQDRFYARNVTISIIIVLTISLLYLSVFAQMQPPVVEKVANGDFNIGEKLTYTLSFNKNQNAGFAEIFCVSKGKLQGIDSVELRMRMKTIDFVSAAYYNIDETRMVFASIESGFPIYTKITDSANGFPLEKTRNLFLKPTQNLELLTAIYKLRKMQGIGSFTIEADETAYQLDSRSAGIASIKTELGKFETIVSSIESPYFAERGISGLTVSFTNDERKIPVLIRFKTIKGEFVATIASIQNIAPIVEEVESTPTPKSTPIPQTTPKPTPVPVKYKENQQLSPDLPFLLGEKLLYAVSSNGQTLANVTLRAKERKLIGGKDTLVLSSEFSDANASNKVFKESDSIISLNDPESLSPNRFEINLGGVFGRFNQIVQFDQNRGTAIAAGTQQEIPIGTYDLLSFAYAIRSFNLKRSNDSTNPVNDTRVAVFIGSKPFVFIVRPQSLETLEFLGRKISAQKVSFSTGNPNIDFLSPQLWLSNDRRRLPLKFSITVGGKVFVAQLINVTN
jgi:Protein of unknown function (DUF3108)